jgi:hypothetical protein
MTRRQQYRFLVAGAIAVFWIVAANYAALAALEAGQRPVEGQPAVLQAMYLPYTLSRTLGIPMQRALGFAGGLLALIVLWIVVMTVLWALMELFVLLRARARTSRR